VEKTVFVIDCLISMAEHFIVIFLYQVESE